MWAQLLWLWWDGERRAGGGRGSGSEERRIRKSGVEQGREGERGIIKTTASNINTLNRKLQL